MNICRRIIVAFSFVCFCGGIILVCVALATDHWILATPILKANRTSSSNSGNSSSIPNRYEEDDNDASSVTFGLFKGVRKFNYGLGGRPVGFSVRHEIKNGVSFMDLATWITVILFSVLTLFWSVIGAIFSLINLIFMPRERLTGPVGLYVWSTLAMLSSFVATLTFVAQYYFIISRNVLLKEHLDLNWTSDELAWFDFSFWLMVGGLGAYSANIFVLLLAGVEMKTSGGGSNFGKEKPTDVDAGVFMY